MYSNAANASRPRNASANVANALAATMDPVASSANAAATGGAKKTAKRATSAPAKKTAKKAAPAKKATPKKGGSLVEDLKNLAVPFAILLAKQGVENMAKENKAKKGGNPTMPIAGNPKASNAQGGGRMVSNAAEVKKSFAKIAQEIDNFLRKY